MQTWLIWLRAATEEERDEGLEGGKANKTDSVLLGYIAKNITSVSPIP